MSDLTGDDKDKRIAVIRESFKVVRNGKISKARRDELAEFVASRAQSLDLATLERILWFQHLSRFERFERRNLAAETDRLIANLAEGKSPWD